MDTKEMKASSVESSVGLRRGTVKLVIHNKLWAKAFDKEKKILQATLADGIRGIEHIGSTAVPGLMAKPIIDMQVAIDDLSLVDKLVELIVPLGYEYLPEKQSYPGRIFLPKGPEDRRTHHLNFVIIDSEDWLTPIVFRNYLRDNISARNRYEETKKELALRYADDRTSYTKAKEQIINELLEEASQETSSISLL